jgi:hypothetical protein
MASPVTVSDFINGVGEYLKLTEHLRRSLFPKEDRDKAPADGFAPYNVAAWEQAVNDVRDIHQIDITSGLTDETETIIKAAVCNLIVALMLDQNVKHPKDPNAYRAKKYFKRYRAIIGRTQIASPSGRTTNIGQSRRLVRA